MHTSFRGWMTELRIFRKCADVKSAYRQGVRCVIATPHYHRNHFHRNPERTMETLQKIRGWLREHLPDMIVLLGTEIYYTIDFAEEIAAGNIFPMAKSRYLLVEFSPLDDYAYIAMRCTFWSTEDTAQSCTCRAVSCLPPNVSQSF